RMAKLPRFYFYVDEFQSMMNEAFADILSESRKYKLALTLANQYIEQMEEEVRDAVFGNVGTLVVFRVGPFDAEVLETVFDPTFTPEDLVGLGIGQIYLTLMIDGVGSKPFSAETIPPIDTPPISYRDDCVRTSRELYGRSRAEVEGMVNQKQLDFQPPPKEKKEREKSSYGSRPRASDTAPRPAAAAATRGFATSAPREDHAPRPAPASSASEPRVAPSRPPSSEVEQRSALRAAIAQAQPKAAETPVQSTPIRSPADILRERLVRKSHPSGHDQGATPEGHAAKQTFSAGNAPHNPVAGAHAPKPPHIPPSAQGSPLRQGYEGQVGGAKPNPQPQSHRAPRPAISGDNGVHEDGNQSAQTGEVSPEVLQRVLREEETSE
ncbi:MAG: TraM recognition domain-containing protein, partial [bacterium]|nr:TraM recognition domain-containing protein [bacterium]